MADIAPGVGGGIVEDSIVAVGSLVYFAADDRTHGIELWRSDGTAAGTVLVADLNPGPGDGILSRSTLTAAGGALYFSGTTGTSSGVFRVDGSTGPTLLGPGTQGSNNVVASGSKIFSNLPSECDASRLRSERASARRSARP